VIYHKNRFPHCHLFHKCRGSAASLHTLGQQEITDLPVEENNSVKVEAVNPPKFSETPSSKTGRNLPFNSVNRYLFFVPLGFFNVLPSLTTWRWLYFPSEGSRAMDFYHP
jgi:hypothetical protein